MTKRPFPAIVAVIGLLLFGALSAGAAGQGESAGGGLVALQYAFWGDQNEINATNAYLDGYMAKNPNVKIEALNFGSNTQFNTKITTLAASNSLPDLGYFFEPNVLSWGMSGKFVDLTDFYKNSPAKLDTIKFVTPDGKIVGISVANEIQVIWYSKKMFDQAGLPYPPAEASKAWSWDHYVDVAKKLTKDVSGKTPNDAGFDPANIRSFGTWIQNWWMPWITFAISNGGGFVSDDGKTLLLDRPETIEAIQKMADLVNVHHVGPAPGTQQMPTAAATALLSQQVAMVVDGTWDLLTIGITKDEQGLDFGIGVLPYMKKLADSSVGTPIVVYKSSKNIPEALKLLKFVMSPENSLPLLKSGLWLPNEKQWYTDPKLISQWVDNPRHPPEYKSAVVDFALNYSHRLPQYYVPTFSKMDDVVSPALQQVWLGQKTAADVINNEIMPKIIPIFKGM
jgi:multiple sugar transport system substrate-binding protein